MSPACQGQRDVLTETILTVLVGLHGRHRAVLQAIPACPWGWIQLSTASPGGVTVQSDAPAARLCQASLHTPAAPQSRMIPPKTSMGLLVGPARARMEPTHEAGRHSLPGSELPGWLRCFGHADLH